MPEDDLELLRAYEPVVRFTRGEYFYPVAVDGYVRQASMWAEQPDGDPAEVASAGALDLRSLAESSATTQGLGRSLSGIGLGDGQRPLARARVKDTPPRLRGTSRLATVGLTGRVVDSLNRASLLVRGSVPGGSALRSFVLQRDHLEPERPTYYGRVLRDDPWIVCQYWFFYSFNNWRSAFGGVNEHEGDWEQVTLYLDGTGETGPDGLPPARWVVFSAHDETGDDLRRRWDDPDLSVVEGRHPVVFAGAGSHSGSYLPGDYLVTVQPPNLGGLIAVIRWFARVFAPWSSDARQGLGVPYVDYARGDGRSIGPGQPEAWAPAVIGDDTRWVRDYRGLWGLDTRDRLGGERGPAGPRYERDGTVRESWADPVTWAGLAKVAPNPTAEAALVQRQIEQVDARLSELDATIAASRDALAVAAAGLPPAAAEVRALAGDEQDVLRLRQEQTRLRDERQRLGEAGAAPGAGPQDHLRHRRVPLEPLTGLRGRFLSWWAVLSTPLVLYAIGAVISPQVGVTAPAVAITWVLLLLSIEGLIRGKFLAVLLRVVLLLAVLTALYFLVVDWRWVLAAGFFLAAVVTLVANLREALRR